MAKLSQQEGFVFYQYPNSDEILFLSGSWTKIDLNTNSTLDGFIISNADKSSNYFLEGKGKVISSSYSINIKDYAPLHQEYSKEEYLHKAESFIKACNTDLDKVILSRVKKHISHKTNNIFETYLNLSKSYNHSFNYLLNIPGIGTWMGATPETLIQKTSEGYSTVSLAGSKPANNINWNQKELDEQQFVTNYIKEKLNNASVSFDFTPSPETVIAGNVAHLKTIFKIQSDKTAINIADLLHPTPAVCGIPQRNAQEFILKNEGYNREFYTGFLGPINRSSSHLFVNLRCMQVFKNENWLYVGGGITTESIPIKEWEETELKAQTLLNILD